MMVEPTGNLRCGWHEVRVSYQGAGEFQPALLWLPSDIQAEVLQDFVHDFLDDPAGQDSRFADAPAR